MPRPVEAGEFAAAMRRLGPWDAARQVAVAVSGGPDSLALALLAQAWGDPAAFIVDHGLRAESAAEAEWTRTVLMARGIPATVLTLSGLRPGAAHARAARYAALSEACRRAGLVDLLLGHHAGDQAETVLMRQQRGSRPDGLAGMAAVVETDDIRLLRPLLAFEPERLRSVLAGLTPVQDPSNTDLRNIRARLRKEIGHDRRALLAQAAEAGRTRASSEAATAAELAHRAEIRPEGFAVLSPGVMRPQGLSTLLRSLSGRRWPVGHAAALAACLRPGTIAGIQVLPAGRLGPGWLLVREAAAMAPPLRAVRGAVWDGRWRLSRAGAAGTLGAFWPAAPAMRARRHGLPHAVLRTLPLVRYKSALSDGADLHYDPLDIGAGAYRVRPAGLPASGAGFLPS